MDKTNAELIAECDARIGTPNKGRALGHLLGDVVRALKAADVRIAEDAVKIEALIQVLAARVEERDNLHDKLIDEARAKEGR